jgi:hypothetical protein
MRRSRRNGHSGLEFVAVVVTKLTGALLFILLLTMVIMALLPKAIDLPSSAASGARPADPAEAAAPLTITTPGDLPEAIAGRPYQVALACSGGHGTLRWQVDGPLPKGLSVTAEAGVIAGTPEAGTPEPTPLVLRVSDGSGRATRATRLTVYQPDRPLTLPSKWMPKLPPIPWKAWLEQGFGFLVLALVHTVGMSTLSALERRALALGDEETESRTRWRFLGYRMVVRLASLGSAGALAAWLTRPAT